MAAFIKIFRVLEEQPAGSLDHLFLKQGRGFMVALPPKIGPLVIIEFDDLNVVKGL